MAFKKLRRDYASPTSAAYGNSGRRDGNQSPMTPSMEPSGPKSAILEEFRNNKARKFELQVLFYHWGLILIQL